MNRARALSKWLAPAAALFALACALLAPAEAGSARRPRRAQDGPAARREKKDDDTPDDSVVRGRVVYDETSRPVRRARVMLIITEGGGRGEYSALTDGRGEFRIPNVRAGSYYAFVDVPGVLSPVGFISLDVMRTAGPAGMPDLGEGRKYFDRVEVDGKQDANVTVHARRGATIAGRVSYADGDAAVNVSISPMRRGADGRLQKYLTGGSMAALAGLRTDDRGMFRLMGLPPGEYVIGVSEAVSHGADAGAGSPGDDISGAFRGMLTQQLLMVFYPSATDLKEAGTVKVEAGEERADVDITIPERNLRTVNGVVRARRGGAPVARARVTISRRDDPLDSSSQLSYYDSDSAGTNATTTDEAGRWQLKEIPDGAYTIQVKPPEEYEDVSAMLDNANVSVPEVAASAENRNTSTYRPRRPRRTHAPARVNLDVSGGDVSEFVVELAEGAHVTGTVTIEGVGQPRYGRVSLVRVGEGGALDYTGTTAGGGIDGGRFDVGGLSSGRYMIQAYVGGGEGEVYLKSVTWNGKDLTREPLELTEGATVEGVHVVFARNPAALTVVVRGDRRRRVGVGIYVMPSDQARWTSQTQLFCRTDEGGTCRVSGAPGEYVVVAMPPAAAGASLEAELRRRAATAPRVTLREGEAGRAEVDAPDK
ncbi:MAG: carboxypeptidase regulatory-like domain-containing protein [Acidobacteria bacterium]|nr:carboxypeptidase regulatory-like domain-containing protein [Acidobacteriota bacterium]